MAAPAFQREEGGAPVRCRLSAEDLTAEDCTLPRSVELDEADAGGDALLKVVCRQGQ